MGKNTTRLVALLPGGAQCLATIKERRNLNNRFMDGDIQYVFPRTLNFEHPTKGDLQMESMKFSFHPHRENNDNTIKHEVRYNGGQVINSVQQTQARFSGLYCMVFCQRQLPPSARSLIEVSATDWVLCRYNPLEESIIIAVYLSHPSAPDINVPNANVVSKTFKYRKIHVAFVFSRLAAVVLPYTSISLMMTSGQQENGVAILPFKSPSHVGLTRDQVQFMFHMNMMGVLNDIIIRLQRLSGKDIDPPVSKLLTSFQQDPYSKTGPFLSGKLGVHRFVTI